VTGAASLAGVAALLAAAWIVVRRIARLERL
jgi:hypothetical protein